MIQTEDSIYYDLLKTAIAKKQVTTQDLENFKSLFRDDIQSERRYASIKSLEDLLDCLERRDKLSESSIEPLEKIAEHLEDVDEDIIIDLAKYTPPPEPAELENVYALKRTQERHSYKAAKLSQNAEQARSEQKPIVIEYTEKKRREIYNVIAREIGRDWRQLGRELGIRAGDLDQIDLKHSKDLQSKVNEMLQFFENDPCNNPKEHFSILCEALDNSKRKDIRRNLNKIMAY